MVLSSRLIAALGLGAAGMAFLAAPIQGQGQGQAQQDGGVRRTAGNAGAAAPAGFKAPIPPVIGTVDLEAVFKGYEKVKAQAEEFNAAAMAKKKDLMKIQGEMAQEAEMLQKLNPGSDDFKKRENHITELKAKMEAGRESAEREFSSREAESMATLYKEIQVMVQKIAEQRRMNYVVRVSNQPISGSNPNSVMAAMSNTMIYADPRNDITNDVVHNLNKWYAAVGGHAAKPAAGAAVGGAPAAAQPAAAAAAQPEVH
ncbi:MAG: OmpH family outer membrane protein [Paludisphaera borealis]|uniref:OmpH family outer membrane protein n=1 Tax=Paludisphaera borealis TaxID=1387353 RepID=UPI0028498046|nr:OmpH family outer membrane protein [Paludisphaera borealis]MDR3622887.1 OmpH family outer membrane protein [Paludisphaera borealis]